MRSLVNELALKDLRQAGFVTEIRDNKFIIKGFTPYVEEHLLKPEGQLVPGTSDTYYHNYGYPRGLIPAFQEIKVDIQHSTKRIQSLCIPEGLINAEKLATILFKAEFVYDIPGVSSTIQNGSLIIRLNGHTDAHKVLDALIEELIPTIPQFDPVTNYVSDLGKLAPFILTYLKNQAKQFLLGNEANLRLLQLKDGDIPCSINLELESNILKDTINKKCREEQMLVSMIDSQLHIRHMPNFIATDIDGLASKQKQINDIRASEEPCYIATTTGGHAFAVKIDFKCHTIFVANPIGECPNFDAIIERVKTSTGITNVIWANTTPLSRTGDIDILDTCTADALVLIHMLVNFEGALSRGCLNRFPLRTGEFAWQAVAIGREASAAVIEDEFTNDKERKREDEPRVGLEQPKTITTAELQVCLNAYRPKSFIGTILWILTFGTHRSETIKALDALCFQKSSEETISLDDLITEISKESVIDSCKQHRINLFFQDDVSNQSGTDLVITAILEQLR